MSSFLFSIFEYCKYAKYSVISTKKQNKIELVTTQMQNPIAKKPLLNYIYFFLLKKTQIANLVKKRSTQQNMAKNLNGKIKR